jgi:hypothetical protein
MTPNRRRVCDARPSINFVLLGTFFQEQISSPCSTSYRNPGRAAMIKKMPMCFSSRHGLQKCKAVRSTGAFSSPHKCHAQARNRSHLPARPSRDHPERDHETASPQRVSCIFQHRPFCRICWIKRLRTSLRFVGFWRGSTSEHSASSFFCSRWWEWFRASACSPVFCFSFQPWK